MPSVHVRAALTWLVIFPSVAAGQVLLEPLTEGWPALLRTALLTALVVLFAVHVGVPRLLWLHARATARARGPEVPHALPRRAAPPEVGVRSSAGNPGSARRGKGRATAR